MAQQKKIDRAVEALLSESTITAAAQKCKVSRRTLTRWLHEDQVFQERLAAARQQMFRHATSRLVGLLGQAVDVISLALNGAKVGKNRYLTAKLVIETGLQIRQLDIDARITQMEQRLQQRQEQYNGWSNEQLESRLAELRTQNLAQYSADDLRRAIREKIATGNGEDDEDSQ